MGLNQRQSGSGTRVQLPVMQPLGWQSIFHRGGLSSVERFMVILLVFPVVVLTGYTWVTLHYAYSLGERFGYVQKISNKGWLCNTWEGELAMTTVPGTAPQIFQFSVRDDATAQRIEQRRYCITYFTLTRYVGTEGKISFTIAELDRYLERRPSVT